MRVHAVMLAAGVACGASAQDATRTDDGQEAFVHVATPTEGGNSPLRLEYTCTDVGGGFYNYEFELIVDNGDGTFAPGQGWGWVIFGDQQQMESNLTDFIGDLNSLPAGPFTQFQSSGGFHNGPTLGPISDGGGGLVYWFPEAVGDSISWAGDSTAQLGDGELLFSTLITSGGAVPADFKPGVKVGGDDPCAADCNEDGVLNILDFVCFQTEWQNQTAAGDCDGNGVYKILDLVCYLGVFS